MVILKILTLFSCIVTASNSSKHTCKWLMDILEMLSENTGKVAEFRLHDDVVHPGRSFFLRLRTSCQNQVIPFMLRSLVYSGYTPVMKLEIVKYGVQGVTSARKILYAEGVFVQFNQSSDNVKLQGDFLTLNSSGSYSKPLLGQNCQPSSWQTESDEIPLETDENISGSHCNESRLCDVAWLVPLFVEDSDVLIQCSVTNPNGMDEKSYIVHSNGFTKPHGNTIGEHPAYLSDGHKINQAFNINRLVLPLPFWLVAAVEDSDYCLFTDTEFERASIIKVHNISQPGLSKVCQQPCSSSAIKETLSLPDRILLSTCFGLREIRATLHDYVTELILPLCIRKIVGPPQFFPGTVKILVVEDSSRVFESKLQRDTSLSFSEILDDENRTLCEFLAKELAQKAHWDCAVQDGSINSIPFDHYVFLVSLGHVSELSYYAVGFTDKHWKILFSFPSSLQNITRGNDEHGERWSLVLSSTSGEIPLSLSGLSFSRGTGDDLFLWGSVLLYSPNGGEQVFWLGDFPPGSNITVFASSEDGSYAFLTNTQKVWWGHIGSSAVHLLEASDQWNIALMTDRELPLCPGKNDILSLFFDVSGELWKVIQCQNSSSKELCISRARVAVADLLSHAQLVHEQTSVEDDQTAIPAELGTLYSSKLSTHCLKFSMIFRALHSNYHTRHIVHAVDVPYLVNTIPVSSDFLNTYLANMEDAMRREETTEVSEYKDVLPAYIYLKKGDYYSFSAEMVLDESTPTVTSAYWSNLDHLRLSYKVSNASLLNITIVEKVFSHKGAVEYQFSLRDSGLFRQRYAPGVGLVPVEFHIQPWQADETCFVKKTKKGVLRGTQSMKVVLGCPPGIKIVFDSEAAVNASGKDQFCDAKHGIPCFLFEHAFFPVFNVLDQTTGNLTLFTGKYRLTVVGGGRQLSSVVDYSEGDKALYNYKNQGSTSTLIWTPKSKDLGSVPSFNISTNGLQWLCGRKSPCAEISPVFPHSPEFYFKLEFSNSGADDDSLNCDLTARFIIRIHGLSLGSLYPATVIVATCIAIISCYVITVYAFRRKNHRLWNLARDFLKSKQVFFLDWIRRTFRRNNSVGASDESSSIEDLDHTDPQIKKEM